MIVFFMGVTGVPVGTDHFAPRYLIGNALTAPPDLFPNQGAPFRYIRDPGDGTGIELALAEIAAGQPGDVWIRPGTYDFNLGAVVAPLVIPPGTTVRGSGVGTTIVRGRDTGDQGVFVVNDGCALRDMSVTVEASNPGGVGSVAAVHALGALGGDGQVELEDLVVSIVTAPGNALREALRVDGAGAFLNCRTRTVRINVAAITGLVSPSIGIALVDSGRMLADALLVFGGDVGVRLDGGGFIAIGFFITGWAHRGVDQIGGTLRLVAGGVEDGGAGAVGAIGVVLLSGDTHSLEQMSVSVSSGAAGTTGIKIAGGAALVQQTSVSACTVVGTATGIDVGGPGPSGHARELYIESTEVLATALGIRVRGGAGDDGEIWITDCRVAGATGVPPPVGIELGGLLGGESVRGVWVRNCVVRANVIGIRCRSILAAPASERCHFVQNEVSLSTAGGLPPTDCAMHIEGVRHVIEGNVLDQASTVGTANALRVYGPNITCKANVVRHTGGPAVDLAGNRITFVGNNVEQLDGVPAPAAVVLRNPAPPTDIGNRCTLGDNGVRCHIAGSPGIRVETSLNTIGDNSITVEPTMPVPTPGIVIAPIAPPPPFLPATGSNTCIGNVCERSGVALPVLDTSIGSDVAHNIGTP